MIRQLIRKDWVLGCAFLLLLGCKTPPAAEAPSYVPYELLNAGEAPRALLRYAIADGTTTTSTISLKVTPREKGASTVSISGLEKMEIKSVFGPAEVDEDEIRYNFEIVDSKAVAGTGASKKLLEDIEESVAFLRGMGALVAMNDRGSYRATRSSEITKDVPSRLLLVINNTLDFASMVWLPEEPVGVGARWTIRRQRPLYGFTMLQEATYTLVERADDEIVLDLEFTRVGSRQVVDFPDDKSSVEVESARMTATGRIRLDLKALGSNATGSGSVNNVVVIVEDGSPEHRVINEDFELRISSTTTVQEAGSETD